MALTECSDASSSSTKGVRWVEKDSWTLLDLPCSQDEVCIVVQEFAPSKGQRNALLADLSTELVLPSGLYLDGRVVDVSTDRVWSMLKWEGRLTRSRADEGITQWGHLMNEVAFCLGHASKYGS